MISPMLQWEKCGLQYNDTYRFEKQIGIYWYAILKIQIWLYEKSISIDAERHFVPLPLPSRPANSMYLLLPRCPLCYEKNHISWHESLNLPINYIHLFRFNKDIFNDICFSARSESPEFTMATSVNFINDVSLLLMGNLCFWGDTSYWCCFHPLVQTTFKLMYGTHL